LIEGDETAALPEGERQQLKLGHLNGPWRARERDEFVVAHRPEPASEAFALHPMAYRGRRDDLVACGQQR
jgi:hypothetical protein